MSSPTPDALLRRELATVVAQLRHAYIQPNLDRGMADGLIAPQVRRLESALALLDAQDDPRPSQEELRAEIDKWKGQCRELQAANVTFGRALKAEIAQLSQRPTLEQIEALKSNPRVPPNCPCEKCASETHGWDAALDAVLALYAAQPSAAPAPRAQEPPEMRADEAAFRAGFHAGLQAVDKFGEQHTSVDEAWSDYGSASAPAPDAQERRER